MDAFSKAALSTLVKAVVFALPLSIGYIALELELRKVVNPYNSARAQADAGARNCEVLVLGSSNAAWGVDASALSAPGLNLANPMQSLYYDLGIAERYLPRMPHVKLVILPLSYTTFEGEATDWHSSDRIYYYAHFWGIPPQGQTLFDSPRWSLTALYGVRMSIAYARKSFNVNTSPTFKAALPAPPLPVLESSAADLAAEYVKMVKEEHLPDNVARLGRLAKLVEQCGAKLVLIETPTQNMFLRHLSQTVLAQDMRARDEFLKRHPGVGYLDFLSDRRFDAGDFWDSAHLNPHGATKLAKILDEELVHPMLATPGTDAGPVR
jgi:hypothetical protein